MARVGVLQLDIQWENVEANVDRVARLLEGVEAGDYDLLVLPELWSCGFTMNQDAYKTYQAGIDAMYEISERLDCPVLGGLPHQTATGQENRCYLVDRGEHRHYAKIKAFKFAGEHLKYEQGDQKHRWDVAGFKLSPFICYDLRFPELPRAMVPATNLISYVACWPSARVAHWRALLVARAIENLSYVIGCNRVGTDGSGLDYPGSSMIISPTGEVLLDTDDREGLYSAEIDPAVVTATRERFRFLEDM